MIATGLLFLSLGLDTLAVAFGLGLKGLPRARWWRVGLTFACFEGVMPILGLIVGRQISNAAGAWAGYAAAGLLIFVGIAEIKESLANDDNDDDESNPVADITGARLLLTGLSVSLDELAVGFSLGLLHVPLGLSLIYITAQAFAVTFLGLALGRRAGRNLGERTETLAGVVLLLLGVVLLIGQVTGFKLV